MYELYTFFNKNDTLFVNFFQIDFQPFNLFLLLCSRRPRISGNPIVFLFTIKCTQPYSTVAMKSVRL